VFKSVREDDVVEVVEVRIAEVKALPSVHRRSGYLVIILDIKLCLFSGDSRQYKPISACMY